VLHSARSSLSTLTLRCLRQPQGVTLKHGSGLTGVTFCGVSLPENWWQVSIHFFSADETRSFFSVNGDGGCARYKIADYYVLTALVRWLGLRVDTRQQLFDSVLH